VARTAVSFAPSRASLAAATPAIDPSAISGASGPSTAPKASVPSAASAMPGVRQRRHPAADALQRRMAAVAGEQLACREHHCGTDDGQPDDAVPLRVVRPQPVLELVDGSEEDGGDQRRRNADRRAEQDQPQVAALGHRTHIIPTGR